MKFALKYFFAVLGIYVVTQAAFAEKNEIQNQLEAKSNEELLMILDALPSGSVIKLEIIKNKKNVVEKVLVDVGTSKVSTDGPTP